MNRQIQTQINCGGCFTRGEGTQRIKQSSNQTIHDANQACLRIDPARGLFGVCPDKTAGSKPILPLKLCHAVDQVSQMALLSSRYACKQRHACWPVEYAQVKADDHE
eukprot:3408408-Pleurochrysis_carterae.AAC.2